MPYKILSLDGGGSWAMIQARVLLDIYGNIRGHALLRKFDMAIANSGGSLVLACLCNNMYLQEIVDVFEKKENREKAFSFLTIREKLKWKNFLSFLRSLNNKIPGPLYSTERKLSGIRQVLTAHDEFYQTGRIKTPIVDTALKNIPAIIGQHELKLIIVGFDYFKKRGSFFRSDTNSLTDQFNKDKHFNITLGHAIHASSNAPVNYFNEPATVSVDLFQRKEQRTTWYWDGAVAGFNNPVLAAVVESITNGFGRNMEDFRILSIGTGISKKAVLTDYQKSTSEEIKRIYQLNKNNPLVITDTRFRPLDDIAKISKSIVSDPPDSATFIAFSFLDPRLDNEHSNLVRINPCITPELSAENPGYYDVPAAYRKEREAFLQLIELDMDAVKDEEIRLIKDLCDKFLADNSNLPNQLIRGEMGGSNILGFERYEEAKERWLKISDLNEPLIDEFPRDARTPFPTQFQPPTDVI
jgi:uncharacterized protein